MATTGLVISLPNQARFKCVSSDFAKGQQDVELLELYSQGRTRLRVRIRSNAYKAQCHAVIERWDGDEWQEVWRLNPMMMETKEGLCYAVHASTKDFTADTYTLLLQASRVLRTGADSE
jgi:hypothetical protein